MTERQATLTSTGRISPTRLVGEANHLTGLRRWVEVWHRLRRQHHSAAAAYLLCVALRRGVFLSGPVVGPRRSARKVAR